ncbi:MAG: hypothetical protein JST33_01650 [Actinobacteria bacterium]|nr:hypothetical protein [Actinomycetota bacterium]
MQFAPGTNWSYAHTSFMILGTILQSGLGHAGRRGGDHHAGRFMASLFCDAA